MVRGDEVTNDVLMLCRLFGMELLFVERSSYKDKKALFDKHFGADPEAIFIDEGGAGELGIKGCAELVAELQVDFDHIICAAGTGTTATGILKGLKALALKSRMHIVPVLKGAGFLKAEIEMYTMHPFEMHLNYHAGGYAKTSDELLEFIRYFCKTTGILIEPIYTGKMFYALYDLIRKDSFPAGSKILSIHTGGLTGIMGMSSKFY
jgi:1-aminocyclopropane-1-carboxylate deaminase